MRQALVMTVAMVLLAAAPAAAEPTLGFDTPTVADQFRPGFEPDVAIDRSPTAGRGQIYTSTPFGFSTTQSFIFRSNDGGASFHLAEGNFLGKPATCIGGGDTELQPDPVNGAIYFSDLQGLTNFSNSTSTDAGRTWTTSCSAVNGAGVDRQWIGVDTNGQKTPVGAGSDMGRLYEDYDNVNQDTNADNELGNQIVMNESVDGVHYGSNCVAIGLPCAGPPAVISRDEGIPGNLVVDDNPGSPYLHTVYAVHTSSSNRSVAVSYCRGKAGDTTAAAVANDCTDPTQVDPSDQGHVNVNWKESLPRAKGDYLTGTLFPSIAVDQAGNVYVAWAEYPTNMKDPDNPNQPIGPGVIKLAVSTDGGKDWEGPFEVSPPELGNNVMPWVTAGTRGRIGIAWYGAQAAQENKKFGPDTLDHGVWNVFYAASVNAVLGSPPTFDITQVTDHPAKFGNISTQGLGGSPDRSLGDFMQAQTGADGQAVISYVDDTSADRNPDYCQGCGQTPAEAAGPIMIARQDSGPSLVDDRNLAPRAHAFGSVTDPAGKGYPDAFFSSNGTDTNASPSLDLVSATVTQADPTHLAVSLKTNDANLAKDLSPDPSLGGGVGEWLVRWAAPSYAAPGDGNIFFVGMQAGPDGSPQFYGGTTCAIGTTHTKYFTFPAQHDVPGSITGDTIHWTVALSDIGKPADGQGLYAITGFTATQAAPANAANNGCSDVVTGDGSENIPNLIDATPPMTYVLGVKPAAGGAPPALAAPSGVLCAASAGFASTGVKRSRHGLRISFKRSVLKPVTVDVFQESAGRNVVGNRLVARFSKRTRSFTWPGRANRRGRRVVDGSYFVRFRMALGGGRVDDRRIAVNRSHGRFAVAPSFYRRESCALLSSFKLERPVFGGRHNRAVDITYRLRNDAKVGVQVLLGKKVVRTFPSASRKRNVTYRLRLTPEHLRRGRYRVRVVVNEGGRTTTATLVTRRI